MILALVLLEVSGVYSGPLTQLTVEHRLAMHFARSQTQACFINVRSVAMLQDPVRATYSGSTFPKKHRLRAHRGVRRRSAGCHGS